VLPMCRDAGLGQRRPSDGGWGLGLGPACTSADPLNPRIGTLMSSPIIVGGWPVQMSIFRATASKRKQVVTP
jgi:hypothetical protein